MTNFHPLTPSTAPTPTETTFSSNRKGKKEQFRDLRESDDNEDDDNDMDLDAPHSEDK